MSTLIEFITFGLISKLCNVPREALTKQTTIPLTQQEDIITAVMASASIYLSTPCQEGLTIGQIIEEAEKIIREKKQKTN